MNLYRGIVGCFLFTFLLIQCSHGQENRPIPTALQDSVAMQKIMAGKGRKTKPTEANHFLCEFQNCEPGNIRFVQETTYKLTGDSANYKINYILSTNRKWFYQGGALLKEETSNLGGMGYTRTFRYDKNGQLIQCGEGPTRHEFQFEKGRLVKIIQYNGEPDILRDFQYDGRGNLVRERKHAPGTLLDTRYEYTLQDDVPVRIIEYDGNVKTKETSLAYTKKQLTYQKLVEDFPSLKAVKETVTEFIYDKRDKLISQKTIRSGSDNGKPRDVVTQLWQFMYDNAGNNTKILITTHGVAQDPATNTIQYDQHGNWTRKMVYLGDQAVLKYERIITYY